MKKIFVILLIIFLAINFSYSQTFSNDYVKFQNEFVGYLKNSGEFRNKSKSMEKEFIAFWSSDTLSEKQRNNFIELASLLELKNCIGYPYFVALTDNIMTFKRQKIGDTEFQSYEMGLKKLLNKNKKVNAKAVSEYLISMNDLLKNGVVLRNIRTYWKIENKSFLVRYENDLEIDFKNVNLIGYQDKDSLKIYNTNATYYPTKKTWKGNAGMAYWERVGFEKEKINVKLQNYSIDMRTISYSADSVYFKNTLYFTEDLIGEFQDRAQNIDNPQKSDYPRFNSYKHFFSIENIMPGLDYEGGFSVRGSAILGTGSRENYAKLKINKNDTVDLMIESMLFYFDTLINASKSRAILHLGKDTIYHPYLDFTYHSKGRLLELIRTKEQNDLSQIAYTNSYHKIYMDFTWLRWKIDEEKIQFNTIGKKNTKEAAFESMNYYRLERYNQIKKRDEVFPLNVIIDFMVANNMRTTFTLSELANFMKYQPQQVLSMVMNLAYLGFLSYDVDFQTIKVNKTATDFIEFHNKTKDSDVIQFASVVSGDETNAELSLLNFDLKINGIYEVHLSDSQKVQIYPKNKKITLKKDCSFLFDGVIKASQFYFYGSNFKFDYNQFLIELANCDSLKMIAATDILDARGERTPAIVRNKIEHINGQFRIDAPANKSGRFEYKDTYPQFTSLDKTYVYYDRPDVYNKIYDRERFYFEIDPFKLVGISGYDPENLRFGGRLVSAGIFPTIEDTLVLRKADWSLGFNMHTNASGLPLYEGKAHYYDEIDLSNKGLRGSGKIDYLTANIDGDYLLFFPDQMTGHADNVEIKEQKTKTQFPQATGKNNKLDWLVTKDKFNIIRDSIDFNMYDNKAVVDGNLILTTNGLKGNGFVTINNARLTADSIDFKHHEILSDTSEFALFTESIVNLDFISKNVNSHIDFEKQKGKFIANSNNTEWRFPKNEYKSQMKEMTWNMDKKELEVNASHEIATIARTYDAMEDPKGWEDLFFNEGPKFTSTHYKQDSLYFFSPRVIFDYDSLVLCAEDVKFLNIADAQIHTNNQDLKIDVDAKIRPLLNAIVISDTVENYHKIYDSYVEINTRNNYAGKGYYDYLDAVDNVKKIFFDTVYTNKDGQTRAKATVTEDYDFSFSPHFKYFGDLYLYADNNILEFDGASSIINTCDTLMPNWLKFKSFIDPKEIYLPIDSVVYNNNRFRLLNGLVYSNTNRSIEPHFLKKRVNQYDQEILTASGFLTYNDEENSYIITSKEKINNPDTIGNYIKFDKFNCENYGEGKINLSRDFTVFNPNAYGNYLITPETDTVTIDLTMFVDAYFSSAAQKQMAEKINSTSGLEGMNLRGDTGYEKAVYEYLGQEEADKWFTNLSKGNYRNMPKKLEDKFVFSDIKLSWDKRLNSFVSYCPIGIANIGNNQVNKMTSAFVRIEKTRRGDIFEMLIEVDIDLWYYFRYSNNFFFGLSSDESFNNIVYEAKDKTKKDENYQYGMGSSVNMKRFKEDMYKYFKITN